MTKDLLVQEQIDNFIQMMDGVPTSLLKEVKMVEYICDKKARTVELGGNPEWYMKVANAFLILFEDREMYEECAELVNKIPELQK